MNSHEGVLEIMVNLPIDHACTMSQILDWYGLDLETPEVSDDLLEFFWTSRREIALSHRSRHPAPVTFLCADEEAVALEDWQLRHLAGLAAARHRLRAPGARWRVTAFGRAERDRDGRWLPDCIPDAIWEAGWSRVALEYDAGSHRLETVAEKARVYADSYAQQLWLAATAERCASVRGALETALPDRSLWRVMRVDWR
jgi:hypothetical protein